MKSYGVQLQNMKTVKIPKKKGVPKGYKFGKRKPYVFTDEHKKNVSKSLLALNMKRKPFTAEHKRKISEARSRQVITQETREKLRKNRIGYKLSDESKKKISESHKGEKSYLWKGGKPKCKDCEKICSAYSSVRCMDCNKKFYSGKNSYSWKGGITDIGRKIRISRKYKEWRIAVLNRDNHTCCFCGVVGGKLIVHHIVLFSKNVELRMNIKNGLTLHDLCHKKLHKFFNDFNKRLYE